MQGTPRKDRLLDPNTILEQEPTSHQPFFANTSKPFTRWWWLRGPFRREDIRYQLHWLRSNGFGGVEIAWLWPAWLGPSGESRSTPTWLSREWSDLMAFSKQYADQIGLGCDFTFGSCWPFGGLCVQPQDAALTFDGLSNQRLRGSWEEPSRLPKYVVNHLSRRALQNYASSLMPAFAGALADRPSALFCDSLELNTHRMWSPELWEPFAKRFGYRLEEFADSLDDFPDVRYDYRKFIAETMLHEFFEAFTEICRRHGAVSRVQCHGALTDLLSAYASVDIPESEAILFDPHFSRIPASAAALAGKSVVSAETFTCIYGFTSRTNVEPYRYWRREQVADLKLLADAVFANGVNHIVWHGMPYNPPGGTDEFFASVHVSPDAFFARELPAFNAYLQTVSSILKLGRPHTNLAVYLPNEDAWMLDRIPRGLRTPGANFLWKMRQVVVPPETEGFHPLWVSGPFLVEAECSERRLRIRSASFSALYVDRTWLDADALVEVLRLARSGLPVVLKRRPRQPGRNKLDDYDRMLDELQSLPSVVNRIEESGITPLVEGDDLPWFWARKSEEFTYIFFAHPKARALKYPMRYGQSLCRDTVTRRVAIHPGRAPQEINLVFKPYQSLLLRISRNGALDLVDIEYRPPEPVTDVDDS